MSNFEFLAFLPWWIKAGFILLLASAMIFMIVKDELRGEVIHMSDQPNPQDPNQDPDVETQPQPDPNVERETEPAVQQPVPASGGAVPTGAEPAEGGEATPIPPSGDPTDAEQSRGDDD